MPKIKSCRSAAKRFKRTKSGNFKRSMAGARHLMGSKASKRRRKLRHSKMVDKSELASVRRMLPYG